MGPFGTTIEGDPDLVIEAIKQMLDAGLAPAAEVVSVPWLPSPPIGRDPGIEARAASLPEVVGDAALTVDPHDVDVEIAHEADRRLDRSDALVELDLGDARGAPAHLARRTSQSNTPHAGSVGRVACRVLC